MSAPKVSNRPKKRTLVRWDDNLDELLLLTVQSVCHKNNIKIPWAEVAATMGHNVTEGAIGQHLAKLRLRRLEAGKDVPPTLRRGGSGTASKSSEADMANFGIGGKRKLRDAQESDNPAEPVDITQDSDNASGEEYMDSPRFKAQRDTAQKKCKKVRRNGDQKAKQEPNGDQNEVERSAVDPEVMVVPGARFFWYPNNRELQSSPSPMSPRSRKSKRVTLKYGRAVQPVARQTVAHQPLAQQPLPQQHFNFQGATKNDANIFDDPFYEPSYGQCQKQSLQIRIPSFMKMPSTQDTVGDYMATNSTKMGLSTVNPADITSNFLDFIQDEDPLPNSFMELLQDDQIVFAPEAPNQQDMDIDEVR